MCGPFGSGGFSCLEHGFGLLVLYLLRKMFRLEMSLLQKEVRNERPPQDLRKQTWVMKKRCCVGTCIRMRQVLLQTPSRKRKSPKEDLTPDVAKPSQPLRDDDHAKQPLQLSDEMREEMKRLLNLSKSQKGNRYRYSKTWARAKSCFICERLKHSC